MKNDLSIRSGPIIDISQASANAPHARRERGFAQNPPGNVHLVNALVAEITIAVEPVPVPIVMQKLAHERLLGGRAAPEVPIEAGWRRFGRGVADAVGHAEYKGQTYYFCAESCLERFQADPETFLTPAEKPAPTAADLEAEYTCPMHPEIRQEGPGSCPICGMALEPKGATVIEGPSEEYLDMLRRFIAAGYPVIVEKGGYVYILSKGVKRTPAFLDVHNSISTAGNEQGLLSLAFHPDYEAFVRSLGIVHGVLRVAHHVDQALGGQNDIIGEFCLHQQEKFFAAKTKGFSATIYS